MWAGIATTVLFAEWVTRYSSEYDNVKINIRSPDKYGRSWPSMVDKSLGRIAVSFANQSVFRVVKLT
jgi:hypothetical protein